MEINEEYLVTLTKSGDYGPLFELAESRLKGGDFAGFETCLLFGFDSGDELGMELAITQLVAAYHERQMQEEASALLEKVRATSKWPLFKLVGDELRAIGQFEAALNWYSGAFDICSDVNKFDLAEDMSAMEAALSGNSEEQVHSSFDGRFFHDQSYEDEDSQATLDHIFEQHRRAEASRSDSKNGGHDE